MSTPRTTTTPNPKIIIGVVVGALVLAAIAVFATADGGDDDVSSGDPDAPLEYGVVTASGTALPGLPDSGDDPAVGTLAPSIVSERVDGQTRLEPGPGAEPTMVVFLAHWCPHCQAEVPRMVS